jgi:hypothetical protein
MSLARDEELTTVGVGARAVARISKLAQRSLDHDKIGHAGTIAYFAMERIPG